MQEATQTLKDNETALQQEQEIYFFCMGAEGRLYIVSLFPAPIDGKLGTGRGKGID